VTEAQAHFNTDQTGLGPYSVEHNPRWVQLLVLLKSTKVMGQKKTERTVSPMLGFAKVLQLLFESTEAGAVPLVGPSRKPGFPGIDFADVDNLAAVGHELIVSRLHNGLDTSWREQPPASFPLGSY
jgi:hypothetical protein